MAAAAVCSWADPGKHPYMRPQAEALADYADIPAADRARLARRIATSDYDDIATIARDRIEGARYYGNLRDMHFGDGRVCRGPVDRSSWHGTRELGLVYCEGGRCVIVPTVCRNVARVDPLPGAPERPASAPQAVPEPGSLALAGLALAGLLLGRRRG